MAQISIYDLPSHVHANDGDLDDVDVNVSQVHAHGDENDTQIDPALDPVGRAHVWYYYDAYLGVGADAHG